MSLPFDALHPKGPALIVDHGCTGVVSICTDDERFALKGYEVWLDGRCYERLGSQRSKQALAREHIVYQHLGSHPNILVYDGQVSVAPNVNSLKIERALGNLREFISGYPGPNEPTRLKMAIQISSGMAYMHSKNVFHCDFSCRNIFVFKDWLLTVGDFGGCKIEGQEPLAVEESRYRLPLRGREWEEVEFRRSELFALGCGIYEIMAWKMPFPDLTNEAIIEKYANEEYPDTDGILGKELIHACWKEEVRDAKEIEMALKEILQDIGDESKMKRFCCIII